MAVYTGLAVLLVLLFLTWRYSILIPPVKGLAVLMYHKMATEHSDELTILTDQLEKQFEYLKKNSYTTLHFSDLLVISGIPAKSVILTFDDAYANLPELLFPLLLKYNFKASIFVPVSFIGKTNEWDQGSEPIMNEEILRSLDRNIIETGLHGFKHINFRHHSEEDNHADIESMLLKMKESKIDFVPVLAYPYGGFPRKEPGIGNFKQLLRENGIQFGLRIGNRINKWPLKDPFEINRIDIKGNDSFWVFRTKLKKGRIKLF